MSKVRLRAAARRDLVEHFVYFAESVGIDTAERFLLRAETAFNDLALQPLMGSPLALRAQALAGLRKWRVRDFDNHLIFYLPRAEGISVVRVLHAARDWWSLLGMDPGS
jgi:toxin ParE1/3/4